MLNVIIFAKVYINLYVISLLHLLLESKNQNNSVLKAYIFDVVFYLVPWARERRTTTWCTKGSFLCFMGYLFYFTVTCTVSI